MNETTIFPFNSPEHGNYMSVDISITQPIRRQNQFYPKVTEKELRKLYEVTRPVYTQSMLEIDKEIPFVNQPHNVGKDKSNSIKIPTAFSAKRRYDPEKLADLRRKVDSHRDFFERLKPFQDE